MLLGAPGAGKTEAFKLEAEHSGGCYVTARDFITFDDKPEWRGTTLFIDGLDEARAGSTDGRTQFDRIRAKLDRLGRPMFRLSCREADWFGAIDKRLPADRIVRRQGYGPAPRSDLRETMFARFCAGTTASRITDGFVALGSGERCRYAADQPAEPENVGKGGHGGWYFARNPVENIRSWPARHCFASSTVTHRLANRDCFDIPRLMDAAGRLCALQLLTGGAGYTG